MGLHALPVLTGRAYKEPAVLVVLKHRDIVWGHQRRQAELQKIAAELRAPEHDGEINWSHYHFTAGRNCPCLLGWRTPLPAVAEIQLT